MAGIIRAFASHVLVTLLDSLQCVRWIETTHTQKNGIFSFFLVAV